MGKVRMKITGAGRPVDLGGGVSGHAPVHAQWVGDRPGDPDVFLTVDEVDGRPFLAELRAVARPGGREVELRDLAQIFTAEPVIAAMWARFASKDDGTGSGVLGGRDADEWQEMLGEVSRRRNRRQEVPRAELERVAAVYREHAAHPDGKPVEAVADALGVHRSTASRRIKAAEEAGLLPPTSQGKKREVT